MKDGQHLNGLLFTSDSTKGLVFFLHGNGGSVNSWASVANHYIDLNYNVLLIDYRGYGKSDAAIKSLQQLFDDLQTVYSQILKQYSEERIIVAGYSLGSGLAAYLASTNHPHQLLLYAPYFSLPDVMKHRLPFVPTFLLKYKIETNYYLKNCKMPITIFHGDEDRTIYYGSSIKLKSILKPDDKLITLLGQGHNGITENVSYLSAIKTILK